MSSTNTKPITLLDSFDITRESILETIVSYFSLWVVPLFQYIVQLMGFNTPPVHPVCKVSSSVQSITDDFVKPFQEKFLQTYKVENNGTIEYNQSIEFDFYTHIKLTELLNDENNTIEPLWKSKILFKNTPRGNVVMHYDVYKQGFSYYSDQQHIPYAILNALAMEYVSTFRCRDFFMDENIIPKDFPSRIVTLQNLEEKKERDRLREENEKLMQERLNLKDAPFAKFKSYKTTDTLTTHSKKEIKEKKQNRFIYLGKTNNFSFIPKRPTKISTNGFESSLLPGSQKTSYSEYKRLQSQKAASSQ